MIDKAVYAALNGGVMPDASAKTDELLGQLGVDKPYAAGPHKATSSDSILREYLRVRAMSDNGVREQGYELGRYEPGNSVDRDHAIVEAVAKALLPPGTSYDIDASSDEIGIVVY